MLKKNLAKVGISGHFTPHSLRATTATRLFSAGIDEQLIQEQTGHTTTSVRTYKRTSSDQKEKVSGVLQNTTTAVETTTPNKKPRVSFESSSSDDMVSVKVDAQKKTLEIAIKWWA